ncbi:MAG: V-type ATP synthase subunit F [Planctomycetota bacterium]|jgi:V/A-type H+-transporting ATPase subunit F
MEGKIAVLGGTDFVMPFSALGVDTYPVGLTAGDIAENAREIISQKYALVVVAENIAAAAEEVFGAFEDAPMPCIVVVPFTTESEGNGNRHTAEQSRIKDGRPRRHKVAKKL